MRKIIAKKGLEKPSVQGFRETIYTFYENNGRMELPWRKTRNPYHILLSEIMLQQTQVERVIDKYEQFLSLFPDLHSLAHAPLRSILSLWQGLGYNRRAIALQGSARMIVQDHNGEIPASVDLLERLPGIGRATASAIAAFAFNKPVIFIETNIRRVFIHFFFQGKEAIADKQILPFVDTTLDRKNPRKWYSALMDYGSMLKKNVHNPNQRSVHYQRQSPFAGSHRQLRGKVLRELLLSSRVSDSGLSKKLRLNKKKVRDVLSELQREGFVRKRGQNFYVADSYGKR